MFDWLEKKGENSRVYMCIKELKWDLEARTKVSRAMVLAMSAVFRNMFVNEGFPANLFNSPFDYSRTDLSKFYNMVEAVRNNSTHTLNQTKTMMKKFGIEMPDYSIRHVKTTNKAIEIWMGTVGIGLVPERRDDMRAVWVLLNDSSSELPNAIAMLNKIEMDTLLMLDSSDRGMFAGIVSEDWISSCSYVPKVFVGKLAI